VGVCVCGGGGGGGDLPSDKWGAKKNGKKLGGKFGGEGGGGGGGLCHPINGGTKNTAKSLTGLLVVKGCEGV